MIDYEELYDEYEEKPRHRKQTLSKKEKVKKADHKHNYADCILSYVAEDYYGKQRNLTSRAKYCTICGKLECNWFKIIEPPKNSQLPVFDVSMWDKAVSL